MKVLYEIHLQIKVVFGEFRSHNGNFDVRLPAEQQKC